MGAQLGLFYSCVESRRPSILPVPESYSSSMDEHEFAVEERHSDEEEDADSDAEEAEDEVPWLGPGDKTTIVKGFPPVSPVYMKHYKIPFHVYPVCIYVYM
jgi:hypothetical protein